MIGRTADVSKPAWPAPAFGRDHAANVTDFMARKLIPANLASKTRRNIYNLLSEVFEVGVDNQLMDGRPVVSFEYSRDEDTPFAFCDFWVG